MGIAAAAALIRFATIARQSFWFDEIATADLTRLPFTQMLRSVARTEGTPPLYYILAWAWSRIFGDTEVALRSLSAIFGTATVAVVFLIGREISSRATGLIAATLVAVSPMLVWYSQEARSYALLAFLVATSTLFFARSVATPSSRDLLLWAVASVLALTTHYFAAFPIAIEGAWFLAATRLRSRPALIAVLATGIAGTALVPLTIHQYAGGERAAFIATIPLRTRIDQTAQQFLAGPVSVPHLELLSAIGLLVLVGLAARAPRRATIPLALAALAVCLALAAVPLIDRFYYRNLIFVPPLLAVGVAAALQPSRLPRLALLVTVGVAAAMLALNVDVLRRPRLQREDWRSLADDISRDPSGVVFVEPSFEAASLEFYDRGFRAATPGARLQAKQVWIVGYPFSSSFPPDAMRLPAGLRLRSYTHYAGRLRGLHYVAARPVTLPTILRGVAVLAGPRA